VTTAVPTAISMRRATTRSAVLSARVYLATQETASSVKVDMDNSIIAVLIMTRGRIFESSQEDLRKISYLRSD